MGRANGKQQPLAHSGGVHAHTCSRGNQCDRRVQHSRNAAHTPAPPQLAARNGRAEWIAKRKLQQRQTCTTLSCSSMAPPASASQPLRPIRSMMQCLARTSAPGSDAMSRTTCTLCMACNESGWWAPTFAVADNACLFYGADDAVAELQLTACVHHNGSCYVPAQECEACRKQWCERCSSNLHTPSSSSLLACSAWQLQPSLECVCACVCVCVCVCAHSSAETTHCIGAAWTAADARGIADPSASVPTLPTESIKSSDCSSASATPSARPQSPQPIAMSRAAGSHRYTATSFIDTSPDIRMQFSPKH